MESAFTFHYLKSSSRINRLKNDIAEFAEAADGVMANILIILDDEYCFALAGKRHLLTLFGPSKC